jgi:hypothetical protein
LKHGKFKSLLFPRVLSYDHFTDGFCSNKADLALIQSTGIDFPERPKVEKKRTLRQVAIMIRATVRMKKGAEQWGKSKKIHERLMTSAEAMRRKARKSSGAAY